MSGMSTMSSAVICCLVLTVLVVVDGFRTSQVNARNVGRRADEEQYVRRPKRYAATSGSVSFSNRQPIVDERHALAYSDDSRHQQQLAVHRSKSDKSSRSPGTPLVRQKRVRRHDDKAEVPGGAYVVKRSISTANINGGGSVENNERRMASAIAMQTVGKQSQQHQRSAEGLAVPSADKTKARQTGGRNRKGKKQLDGKGSNGERGKEKVHQRVRGRPEKTRLVIDPDQQALVERIKSYRANRMGKNKENKVKAQLRGQSGVTAKGTIKPSAMIDAEAKHRSGVKQRQRQQEDGAIAESSRRESNDGRRRQSDPPAGMSERLSSQPRDGPGRLRSGSKQPVSGSHHQHVGGGESRRVIDNSSPKTAAHRRPSPPAASGIYEPERTSGSHGNQKRNEDGEKRAKRSRKKRRLSTSEAAHQAVVFPTEQLSRQKLPVLPMKFHVAGPSSSSSSPTVQSGGRRREQKGYFDMRQSSASKTQRNRHRNVDEVSKLARGNQHQRRAGHGGTPSTTGKKPSDTKTKMKRSVLRMEPSQINRYARAMSYDRRSNRK